MKNNLGWIGFLTAGMTALAACGGKDAKQQQQAPPPASVTVTTVQQGNAVYQDQYPGNVVALNQVEIRPQVSGYITGIFFTDGQHVSKGQKLYSIDQQQYAANYNQSLANLEVAKSNLAKAQQDANRYLDLQKNDAIAKQTVDHALADLESAKRQVEAAKANVASVQTGLKYSTIYAPFDGTIGISSVKLGASVSPGSTLLNTLSSDNPIAVDFNVDEKELPRFVQLQQQKLTAKDSTFSITLADQSKYPLYGHIALIDRAVNQQTGTIKTRLVFENPKNILRAGMNCNVQVVNYAKDQVLIPAKAVVEQMGEYFVFVVDSSKAKQRKVILGPTLKDKRVVKDGVKEGEQIVVEGVQKLRDNTPVQVGGAPGASGASGSTGTTGKK